MVDCVLSEKLSGPVVILEVCWKFFKAAMAYGASPGDHSYEVTQDGVHHLKPQRAAMSAAWAVSFNFPTSYCFSLIFPLTLVGQ